LLNSSRRASNQGTPVLLYGAGSGGVAGVRELFDNPQAEMRPIGFIDDDLRKTGRLVSGLPVLGSEAALEDVLKEHAVKALLVTSAKIAPQRVQRAKEICDRAGVNLLRLDIRVERFGEERSEARPAEPAVVAAPVAVPTAVPALAAAPAAFAFEQLGVLGVQ